ncbi:hypothetical protein Droror1_Dr00025572 [Drosera rotundifolia]
MMYASRNQLYVSRNWLYPRHYLIPSIPIPTTNATAITHLASPPSSPSATPSSPRSSPPLRRRPMNPKHTIPTLENPIPFGDNPAPTGLTFLFSSSLSLPPPSSAPVSAYSPLAPITGSPCWRRIGGRFVVPCQILLSSPPLMGAVSLQAKIWGKD